MNNEVNVPDGVKVWWLGCLEHWDVRPVNEAAVEATKLRSEWPTDCDVVALSDLPKIVEQARSQERRRVLDLIFGEYDLLDRNHGWPVKRDEFEAVLDTEDPEQPEGGED